MAQANRKTPETAGQALIYGLDPLDVKQARTIVTNPERHKPLRRALAWATLCAAAGKKGGSRTADQDGHEPPRM